MAMLAFAAAGAAVGSLFGAPSIGWMAGRFVGQALLAKDTNVTQTQVGPRLSDLKVQSSAYGQSIPVTFGRISLAGNLIWSSDLIEAVHVSSQSQHTGGKGGGGSTVTTTTTTYTYSAHLAVGICEGPIVGVRKVWANGKLIYNAGDGADGSTVAASNSRASGIRFYVGDASQLPDPIIESYEGVGNVPGYRNLAYAVFEDLQLADFGNAIPNFEFEVLAGGSATYLTQLSDSHLIGAEGLSNRQVEFNNGIVNTVATVGLLVSNNFNYVQRSIDLSGNVLRVVSGKVNGFAFDPGHTVFLPAGNWLGLYFEYLTDGHWRNYLTETESIFNPDPNYGHGGGRQARNVWKAGAVCLMLWDGYAPSGPSSNWTVKKYDIDVARNVPGQNVLASLDTGVAYLGNQFTSFWDGSYFWLAHWPNAGGVDAGTLEKYDIDLNLLDSWVFTFAGPSAQVWPLFVHNDLAYFGTAASVSCELFRLNSDGTMTSLSTTVNDSSYCMSYPNTDSPVAVGTTKIINLGPTLAPDVTTLSSVVEALCLRAGLSAGDIDVSALTDNITGYMVSRRGPLSAALQPLMSSYFFDPVESDGKLKFRKRDGSSVVTFDSQYLAARAAGEDLADVVSHSRQEELELPAELAVLFFNDNSAYEQGAQYSRRLTTQVENKVQVDLPLVLTDTQAKRVADTLLFDAWVSRDVFSWRSDRRYAKYEPGDVVTVPASAGALVAVRITKRDDGANGVIAWEGAAVGDSTIYTQTSTTQDVVAPGESLAVVGPTNMELMDAPLLRDRDDDYGIYVGIGGYTSEWHGAVVFRSSDNGSVYTPLGEGAFAVEAVMGVANAALASVSLFDQFDEKNTVSVTVFDGTLSSVTRDQVLNGANSALIGDEVIQFRTATLTAAGVYTLSGLLRARCGTRYAVGTHVIGERFVLLDPAAVRFVAQISADVNVERLYRAVSIGNFLADADTEALTYTGRNIKPLAPVHARGGRNAALDLSFSWTRCTRLNATWRDYVDAPLGEDTESYEVDIMSGSTVKRTISVSSATATYTAAQQITDFGSTQASITMNIYQLSSRIGRGYACAATL